MSEEKTMTLGYFREYTKNLPDDMPIYVNDVVTPIPVLSIHQKILVDNIDQNDEILSIILEFE